MALVGQVARPHGLRGQVIVNPETDFPDERFRPGAEVFGVRGGVVEGFVITTARFHQGRPIIGLRGIEDVDAALALAGTELRVPIDQLTPLPDGVFYRHELVGCEVVTAGGIAVGTVGAVEGEMGDSRLVLQTALGEVLIPLASAICVSIDPAAGRIVVEPPEGLLELNAPAPRRGARGKPRP